MMDRKQSYDVWDVLNRRLRRTVKPAPISAATGEAPWYQHRNAPKQGQPPARVPMPRPKPRTAPPMPTNKGDQGWWQDKRVPRQWQDQTKQTPPGPRPKPKR